MLHFMRLTAFSILIKYQSVLKSLQILSVENSLSSIINPLHSQVIKVNADFIPLCSKKIKSWLQITNLENDLSLKTKPYDKLL